MLSTADAKARPSQSAFVQIVRALPQASRRGRLKAGLGRATSAVALVAGLGGWASDAWAVPAVFFNSDLVAGEQTFIDTAAAADAAYNEAHPGSTQDSAIFRLDLTNSTGSSFAVTSGTTTVYVATTRAGSPALNGSTGDEGGEGFTNWDVDYPSGDWAAAADAGYTVSFYSDVAHTIPYLVNAVGLNVSDWGTCCASGTTPDGSVAAESQIYMQFNGSDPLLVGGIGTPIDKEEHFVAAIDDRNTFSSVTLIPNGDGELFGVGGILTFSTVQLNSVPDGSSVVDIGDTPDIDTAQTSYTTDELAAGDVNPVFDGGTLAVSAAGTVTNDFSIKDSGGTIDTAGNDATFSGVIGDAVGASGSLAKTGEGTLILTGANSYSGGTTISAGTLQGNTTSLQGDIANNATLAFAHDSSGTYSGMISGTGDLVKSGTGTVTLTGAQSYTGSTDIAKGTLALSGSGSIASSSGVVADGTFDISGTTAGASVKSLSGSGSVALGEQTLTLTDASGSFGGSIAGTGGLTVSGGTETLTGSSSYTGATAIDADGTLALSGAGSIASSSSVAADGTFDISGTAAGASVQSLSGSGSIMLGDQTLTLTDASGSFSGGIGGTGGLALSGGTETLTGINGYTGATTISVDSKLVLSSAGSVASSSGIAVEGVLDIADTTAGASVKSLLGSGSVALGAQTLTLTDASGSFAGSVTGSGGVIVSSGTETLSGTSSYTGATSVGENGTLALSGTASIAASSGVVVGGIFDISGTTAGTAVKSLSGGGSANLGNQTLTLTDAADSFGGDMAGTGGLTVSGGTETLTGSNSYTGATTIGADGALALSGTGSIASSSGIVADGTFDISATTAGALVKSLAGDGNVAIGDQTLTLAYASGTFGGSIGGSGGIAVTGGTEILSSSNGYTGATAIRADGTLALSGAGSIAASSGVAVDGAFDISATTISTSVQSLTGSGSVALGGQTLTLTDASGSFGGDIAGTGSLTVSGGTQTLTGTSSYTGVTAIGEDGTLALSGTGSIAASRGVVVGGTFDISGTTAGTSVKLISGSGSVALGNQTLTLTDASGSFGGDIAGTGGLTVSGGTGTLSGANSYTGATTISADSTLALLDDGSIASSGGVAADGTFDISGTTSGASVKSVSGSGSITLGDQTLTLTRASGTFGGSIGGSGGIAVTGGTEVLTGTNSYSGSTTISSGGALTVSGGAALSDASAVEVTGTLRVLSSERSGAISGTGRLELAAGTLIVDDDGDSRFDGTITGGGSLAKTGAGTLTLTGDNDFAGGLTIDSGAVRAASDASLGSGTMTIGHARFVTANNFESSREIRLTDADATIDSASHDVTLSGTVSGKGTLNKVGEGTLTLTGQNSQNGINVKGGTLAFDSDAALGASGGVITIEENTTLHTLTDFTIEHTLNVHNTERASFDTDGHHIVMAGNITGAGTVQKIGAGTLTLTGENSQVVMEVLGGTVIASSQGSVGAAGGDIFLSENSTFATGTDMTVTQDLHVAGANAMFDTGANSVVLSGTADGDACLIKIGSGRLNLVADASNEIGACVEEGTLSFNSAFTGHVWVEQDGTAGGSGLINGDMEVRGTLAPGNSPGRLVVAGNVTQTDGSNFLVDIDGRTAGNGAGHYDTLVLTGADSIYTADGTLTPRLRGITGDANNNFTPVVGDMFRIVAAEGGVAGTYDTLAQPAEGLPENARFDVLYRPNAVYLTVTPGSYAAIFGSDTQRNAATAGAAVDTLRGAPGARADGGKADLLDGLMGLDEGQLVRAFSQVAGEIHADAIDSVVQASRSARASVSDHLNAGLSAQGTLDEDLPLSRRLWGAISHEFGTVHADRNGRAYRSNTTAMVIGIDGDLSPAAIFGVAVAYNQSETRTDILGGSEGSSYHALAYGRWHQSDYYANIVVDAGPDVYDVEREVDLFGCSCALDSSPDGFSVGADVEFGRRFHFGVVTVTPAVGLGYDGINRDSFIESGDAAAALEFGGDRRDALAGRIGARLSGGFAWGGMTLRPYGSLFVSHELMDAGTELNPALHGARFDVEAPVAGRTAVRGAAGVNIDLTQDFALGFSYRYRGSGNAQNNAFSGSISLRF